MDQAKILIIDDDYMTLKSYEIFLRELGDIPIITTSNPMQVEEIIKNERILLVITDLQMPIVSGEDILLYVKEHNPQIPVAIITAIHDVETAVRCINEGATDYLVKPVEKERLCTLVTSILVQDDRSGNKLSNLDSFHGVIATDRKMQGIFQYIVHISQSEEPVLITGETGVGKEEIAKSIYRASGNKGDFIAVNVAGLDDNMFSDALFGHQKGAFTGADHKRKGLIEKAENGTLFLDEIGDLNMASQVKLLRLIQDREYFPVGSDTTQSTNASFILATNRDLKKLMERGEFRKDLFYRLSVHSIYVPPLRERPDDIKVLTDYFFKTAAQSYGKTIAAYPPELITLFKNYHFPGNVRELRSIIYDVLSSHEKGMISIEPFKNYISSQKPSENREDTAQSSTFKEMFGHIPTIAEVENKLIAEALQETDNNKRMAASLLGISRQTLIRKVKYF